MRRLSLTASVVTGLLLVAVGTGALCVPRPFDLQRAIDGAEPGAVVEIPAGSYTGPFQITGKTDLTLRGPADAVLTATGKDVISIHDSAGIAFEGFTVVGDYGMRGQKCVSIDGLRGGAFRDLTIRDAGNSGIYSSGVFADVSISGCAITHCGDLGIAFQTGGDGVSIEGCTLRDFASAQYPGHGVYARTSNDVTVRDCEVSGVKHLSGQGDGGFQIADCTGAQLIDCVSLDNDQYGFIVDGGVASFVRCRGQGNGVADFYEFGTEAPSTYIDCTGTVVRSPSA